MGGVLLPSAGYYVQMLVCQSTGLQQTPSNENFGVHLICIKRLITAYLTNILK